MISRRDWLKTMGTGFGMTAFASLANSAVSADPLAPKAPHFPAKAKHVIFLFLNGGPSQVDTFDPKPMLDKYSGKPMPSGNLKTERKTGNLLKSPFEFHRCGESGIEVSEIFPKLGARIDDCCVIRSMYTDRPNHEPSLLLMNTGDKQVGRPSMGSWLTYGLGSENQNLPGFVVLCPGLPVLGPQLWASTFLPAAYQGTYIPNGEKTPDKLVQFIRNPELPLEEQRRQLDLLEKLNRIQLKRAGEDRELEASIQASEIAYRMQTEAPEVFDISKEPESVRARYGDSDFGRGCLMSLRLIEKGVRMVQVYYGNNQPWDNHDDILIHRKLARDADGPMAALLEDLKSRGLLDETLVIISGEFGRTPVVEVSGLVKVQNGRDHNSHGFSTVVAGGGIRRGHVHGATDDFGFQAVEKPVHIHDLHATLLYLLGLDHTKLTYRYSGRDFRLTDVAGNVVREIVA
ncbi:MAG TPA: DUF1501 domain-containing protein [Bryobacteraceae bacterium]|nr:DUF1501 domain-containing protein [Bryobacteraceae bacterium]